MLLNWNSAPQTPIEPRHRLAHVRYCSPFAAALLDRHPGWGDDPATWPAPAQPPLQQEIQSHGLEAGLRRFRNHQMLRIVWRDLAGLASLDETFAELTALAELCLEAAIVENGKRLQAKYGAPYNASDREQHLCVIGLGKLGGGELNLSSDIDIMFCFEGEGECRGPGRHKLSSEHYFLRLARAVIASLADTTEEGFCFRVDARLRPFGESGPLCSSLAAMEQYYQREGRDWERYALIKARPVAGDLALGQQLMRELRPFIYRRYIDFSAVEALQDMHANVREDAQRTDRLDDIKRGPGGIREIEFLVQCFQLLRGGREPLLQSPSLKHGLGAIAELGLLSPLVIDEIRADYVALRTLENRIQALRDQQTHRLPQGDDLPRLIRAMAEESAQPLHQRLRTVRDRVEQRFQDIFPARPQGPIKTPWVDAWQRLKGSAQPPGNEPSAGAAAPGPLAGFLRRLDRLPLSQRAGSRLDQFMPLLLQHLQAQPLEEATLNRVLDLVLAICQRSAYLVLLVQNPPALERMIDLFARSEWIAEKVTRFPALLDELIDPSLGRQIPGPAALRTSVERLLSTAPGTEAALEGLATLKLATTLRIAVAHLEGGLDEAAAQAALTGLAAAVLQGALDLAAEQIEQRHGRIQPAGSSSDANSLAVIAYGSLGAGEMGYDSDLDIVFLFDGTDPASTGERRLSAERYYARLAQRMLSFMTAMTPAGRLYAVDTRLRPNGRAGSLVSSLQAFAEYQQSQAWTWELQALTRARFVAGCGATGQRFDELRRQVLSRPRAVDSVRAALANMREQMVRGQLPSSSEGCDTKYRAGGLVDIGFIVQFGVLTTASVDSTLLQTTATLEQLAGLAGNGWISSTNAALLERTARALHQQRLLHKLIPTAADREVDTAPAAGLFAKIIGSSVQQT